jgi:hypothetical protein
MHVEDGKRQKLGVPNYDDDKYIVIYKPPKQVSGTYADGDYFTTRTRDVCKPACMPNAKTAAEIRENPSRYLCTLGYFSFVSLTDIKSLPPALTLHSLCKRAVQRGNDFEPRAGRQQLP